MMGESTQRASRPEKQSKTRKGKRQAAKGGRGKDTLRTASGPKEIGKSLPRQTGADEEQFACIEGVEGGEK